MALTTTTTERPTVPCGTCDREGVIPDVDGGRGVIWCPNCQGAGVVPAPPARAAAEVGADA